MGAGPTRPLSSLSDTIFPAQSNGACALKSTVTGERSLLWSYGETSTVRTHVVGTNHQSGCCRCVCKPPEVISEGGCERYRRKGTMFKQNPAPPVQNTWALQTEEGDEALPQVNRLVLLTLPS